MGAHEVVSPTEEVLLGFEEIQGHLHAGEVHLAVAVRAAKGRGGGRMVVGGVGVPDSFVEF
jgi:hypothetical protein